MKFPAFFIMKKFTIEIDVETELKPSTIIMETMKKMNSLPNKMNASNVILKSRK